MKSPQQPQLVGGLCIVSRLLDFLLNAGFQLVSTTLENLHRVVGVGFGGLYLNKVSMALLQPWYIHIVAI